MLSVVYASVSLLAIIFSQMKEYIRSVFILVSCGLLAVTYGCTDADTVTKTWDSGRSGFLRFPAGKKANIDIFMSTSIMSADFFCLKLISTDGVKFSYTLRDWCPIEADGRRKISYSLYFKGPERKHNADVSRIVVNGVDYCKDDHKQSSGDDKDCSKLIKKDKGGPGYGSGTFTIPIAKALRKWTFAVGFDRDVTGFNINEAQPDPAAKDPCPKINTHKYYEFNQNMTAGTHTFKYYLTYDASAGEPKIVYLNIGDAKSSTKCGTKPTCP